MEPAPTPQDNTRRWYEVIPQPEDPNSRIWKYMDFTKFVSLLESQKLFFSRLDLLGDKFEGSTPRPHVIAFHELDWDQPTKANHQSAMRTWRTYLFASCWHLAEFENAALWKLYGLESRSVAICATYSKLCALSHVKVGLIRYIDYETEVLEQPVAEQLAMLKRRAFEYENEVRALVQKTNPEYFRDADGEKRVNLNPNSITGIPIAVDLSDFLDEVVVSPEAEDWFADLVEKSLRRYEVDVPVKKSELSAEPNFDGVGIRVEGHASPDSEQ